VVGYAIMGDVNQLNLQYPKYENKQRGKYAVMQEKAKCRYSNINQGEENFMPVKPHERGKWPPKVCIYIYDENMVQIDESKDTKYDLHDSLMQAWPYDNRTVYLGVDTLGKSWTIWDEDSIACVEYRMNYDLHFDGNEVVITRITDTIGQPCSQEFLWRLDISN